MDINKCPRCHREYSESELISFQHRCIDGIYLALNIPILERVKILSKISEKILSKIGEKRMTPINSCDNGFHGIDCTKSSCDCSCHHLENEREQED